MTQTTQSSGLDTVLRNVFQTEAEALAGFGQALPETMPAAVALIAATQSQVIVAGVGKSGHIARKIAATFRSVGCPAAYLHPAEASHGDLGIIDDNSIVLVLSYSGETAELGDLLAYCRQNKNTVISITAQADSTLGRASAVAIAHGKVTEACINGLAPTTSTTLALAIGDALAVGFSHVRGKAPADFRRFHPGGSLGAQLITVGELMHRGADLPLVATDTAMQEVVVTMSEKAFGVAIVVDPAQPMRPVGIITDGDMRRNASKLWQSNARDVLSGNPPVSIAHDALAVDALRLMSARLITSLIVNNASGDMCGLLTIHDCLRAGVRQ